MLRLRLKTAPAPRHLFLLECAILNISAATVALSFPQKRVDYFDGTGPSSLTDYCAASSGSDGRFRNWICVGLDCRAALIAAKMTYTRPDQEAGTMRCVAFSSSKWCDAIRACAVAAAHFSCRRSLRRPRRSPSRLQPMTNNGSVRHKKLFRSSVSYPSWDSCCITFLTLVECGAEIR